VTSPRLFRVTGLFDASEADYLIENAIHIDEPRTKLQTSIVHAGRQQYRTSETGKECTLMYQYSSKSVTIHSLFSFCIAIDTSSDVSINIQRRAMELLGASTLSRVASPTPTILLTSKTFYMQE
jgi:hypothetical protein